MQVSIAPCRANYDMSTHMLQQQAPAGSSPAAHLDDKRGLLHCGAQARHDGVVRGISRGPLPAAGAGSLCRHLQGRSQWL